MTPTSPFGSSSSPPFSWSARPSPSTPQSSVPPSPNPYYFPGALSESAFPGPTPPPYEQTETSNIKRRRSRPLPKVPLRVDTSPNPPPRKTKARPLPTLPIQTTLGLPMISPARPLPRPNVPGAAPPRIDSLQARIPDPLPSYDRPPIIDISPPPSATLSLHFAVPPSPVTPDDPCPTPVPAPPSIPIMLDIQASTQKTQVELARRLSQLGFVEVVVTPDPEEKTPPTQECVVYLEESISLPTLGPPLELEKSVKLMPMRDSTRRYSRKWIREKNGKRWVEDNYQDIIHALRLL